MVFIYWDGDVTMVRKKENVIFQFLQIDRFVYELPYILIKKEHS